MIKDNGMSIKISSDSKKFLKRLKHNRWITMDKLGTNEKELTEKESVDLIVKYFKLNNERYLELIKTKL